MDLRDQTCALDLKGRVSTVQELNGKCDDRSRWQVSWQVKKFRNSMVQAQKLTGVSSTGAKRGIRRDKQRLDHEDLRGWVMKLGSYPLAISYTGGFQDKLTHVPRHRTNMVCFYKASILFLVYNLKHYFYIKINILSFEVQNCQ